MQVVDQEEGPPIHMSVNLQINVWDSVNGHVANGVSVKWSKGSANGTGTPTPSRSGDFQARDAGYASISATKRLVAHHILR